MSGELIIVTRLGDAAGSLELAAALAVTAAQRHGGEESGAALLELCDRPPPRPTIIASAAAREAESALAGVTVGRGAARGRICHLRLPADREGIDLAGAALAAIPGQPVGVLHAGPELLRALVDDAGLHPRGAVLRADLELDRSLAALIAGDLSARGLRVRVAKRPPGWLTGRLALIGVPSGEGAGRDAERLLSALLTRRPTSKRSLGMIVEC